MFCRLSSSRLFFRSALLSACLFGAGTVAAQMPRIELSTGIHRVNAEVAANDDSRQRGLMFRKVLPPQDGMLFVFERSERFCMWMKNTYVPLSVAFIDEHGVILNIENMKPESLDSHCAAQAARYALEMNAGWFEKRGIKSGAKVSGLDRASQVR